MFICNICSTQHPKWQGRCTTCGAWNSVQEAILSNNKTPISCKKPLPMHQVVAEQSLRIVTGISELDNVLGGGLVLGSVLILTGDPGVGKSTLTLQIAQALSINHHKVIYFSTEESLAQLKNKITRFQFLQNETLFSDEHHLINILQIITEEKPILCIIDSLQNCRLENELNIFGINYLKEIIHKVVETAKASNVAVILTGHITKDGSLAGPKVVEHLVDGVFHLQDETNCPYKILVATKNRFGATDEIGFFEMTEQGLSEVGDVNQQLLNDSYHDKSLGSTLFLSFKGSKYLLSEFQALCVKNRGNIPQRIITGIDGKKVLIVVALLEKYFKIDLSNYDIFFKIKGSIKINDEPADLAIAIALLSSYFKIPTPAQTLIFGEVNLSGKVTTPNNLEKLIKSAKKLGIDKFILGKNNLSDLTNKCLTISHIYEIINLFREESTANQGSKVSAQQI